MDLTELTNALDGLTDLFLVFVTLAILVVGFWKGREWFKNIDGGGGRDDDDLFGPLCYEKDEYDAVKLARSDDDDGADMGMQSIEEHDAEDPGENDMSDSFRGSGQFDGGEKTEQEREEDRVWEANHGEKDENGDYKVPF